MLRSVLLKTPLAANTGYGHDGFALARSFTQAGLDVRLLPTAVIPPLPAPVAQLFVKPLDLQFDYFVHHVSPSDIGMNESEKRMKAMKIAWTMWEFPTLNNGPSDTFAEQLDGYDLLLAYDEVSAEAFAPYAEQAGVPMRILQGGYWSEDWAFNTAERDWEGAFRFIMVGQLNQRKNPFAAIDAFREVREEFSDAELHLKTTVQTLHPALEIHNPGLKIHYEMWPHDQLKKFYSQSHCYVAPSWGEGKNLPALESQTMGIPVIYSDVGGHRQWGDSSIGWPIPGELMGEGFAEGAFLPNHDALVTAMKEAISNRSLTKRKGEMASRQIPSMCDWSVVIRRFLDITNADTSVSRSTASL